MFGASAVGGCSLLLTGNGLLGRIGTTVMVGLYAAVSCVVWAGARQEKLRSFGAANAVTLVRLTLATLLAGCAAEIVDQQLSYETAMAWFVAAVSFFALATDACDGWLARRLGTASSFGARFDMETDALLMIVLCILVWMLGKAGPWILAGGMMRYAFIVAGVVWPPLRMQLPPSFRRKAVCVLQIAALIMMLTPAVEPSTSSGIGLVALLILVWSFAVDIAWLIIVQRKARLAA